MPSWKKVITSGSNASLSSITASNGAYFNGNVIITGSLTVGATTAGVSENTLTLGPRDNGSEGGQLMFQAPGGTYTSASMWDNYANRTRLLRGTNAGSDAEVASFNMHSKQVTFPAYNNVSSFPGSAAAFLAVDSSGNLITTSSAGGGGGGVTINNNVDNYVITGTGTLNTLNGESNLQFNGTSLTVTGQITSSGAIISQANGAMYFRGGDDAEFWDINLANHVGIYGQQDATVASVKLGSGGGIVSGKSGKIGINTISPSASLDVIGSTRITGSLEVTGSFNIQTNNGLSNVTALDFGGVSRIINDVQGVLSIDADARDLYDSSNINSVSWEARRLIDTVGSSSIDWGSRLLKIDNGPGAYTVNWNAGILRDTNSKNSVDWQNRQLKNNNGDEILNWQSGVKITGSAIVSGSFESTGSFKVYGAGTGFAGPFAAIEVDDVNFSRKLYDYTAGSASIDFGNRNLLTQDGNAAISWTGQTGTYNTNLYNFQTIDSITRSNLYSFNTQGGQTLAESYFDIAVIDNDLVYLNTDGQWYQVDQTTDSSTKMLGIAKNVFSQTGSVFIEGDIVVTTATGYPAVANAGYGLPVYIKQSAGTSMDTATPASGYVRILGHCYYTPYAGATEWIMKFKPSNDWYVI